MSRLVNSLPESYVDHRMEKTIGPFHFSSRFDSGNLHTVEDAGSEGNLFEYDASTTADCQGTRFQQTSRTWFHFRVTGGTPGQTLKVNMNNMNKQSRLYAQGLQPIVRVVNGPPAHKHWGRHCSTVEYTNDGEEFRLSFTYDLEARHTAATEMYFAFCYPFSYAENQSMLEALDAKHQRDHWDVPDSLGGPEEEGVAQNAMYYHRELLVSSIEGLRVDLVTISSCHGLCEEREQRLPKLFPDKATPRAHTFGDKPVFFLSARVHPGESPASHCFNGFLKFILQEDDPRAVALRRLYVFKLVPILNPDGVLHGHYRSDTRGANLNRHYNNPDPELHPSIYASRALNMYHNSKRALKVYLDLHAHATRRGMFIYGNSLDGRRQVDNVMYAKLISLNTQHFDFDGCNFSEKNMFSKDKRDGQSKEGSGRVGMFYATDLTHIYTLECNYNTGRVVNSLPLATGDGGRAGRPPLVSTPPPYDISHFEDVGAACAVAALDLRDQNPWSRLPATEHACLSGLRRWVAGHIRGSNKMKASNPATKGRIAVARRAHKAAGADIATKPGTGSAPRMLLQRQQATATQRTKLAGVRSRINTGMKPAAPPGPTAAKLPACGPRAGPRMLSRAQLGGKGTPPNAARSGPTAGDGLSPATQRHPLRTASSPREARQAVKPLKVKDFSLAMDTLALAGPARASSAKRAGFHGRGTKVT